MESTRVIAIEQEHMAARARYAEAIGKLQAVLDVSVERLDDRLIDNIRQGMTTGHDARRVEQVVDHMHRALAESERIWKGE